jgi:5-methylcytosine-specific restriction endonuclease McrA
MALHCVQTAPIKLLHPLHVPRETKCAMAAIILYDGPLVTRAEARACGMGRYFNGVPCTSGHIAQRNSSSAACLECDRLRNRERRAKVSVTKEKIIRSPEDLRERARLRGIAFRARRPGRSLEASRRWIKNHPEKAKSLQRLRSSKRRALIKGSAVGQFTLTDEAALLNKQRGRCAICGKKLRKRFHVDHITPLARGGEHKLTNLQITHPKCNMTKSSKDPIDFARSLGRLL